MNRKQTAFATLFLASAALVAGSAVAGDPAASSAPATAQAAAPAAPAAEGGKITKSRSNIQNNREAAPPTKPAEAPPASEQSAVKTKTKSNQSND